MDNDQFSRKLPPCLRKPYNAVRMGASPEEFARLCAPALATFFQNYGCPGFERARDFLAPWCAEDGRLPYGGESYDQICRRCDEVEHKYSGAERANLAHYVMRAVKGLIFQAQADGKLRGNAGNLLAQQVCLEIIDATLVAKLDGTKAMETFVAQNNNSLEDAQNDLFEWKQQLTDILPEYLAPIAQKLAKDPSGKNVKSKAVRIPKRSTLEIMGSFGRVDLPEPSYQEKGVNTP